MFLMLFSSPMGFWELRKKKTLTKSGEKTGLEEAAFGHGP